jgi:hypothetical protein
MKATTTTISLVIALSLLLCAGIFLSNSNHNNVLAKKDPGSVSTTGGDNKGGSGDNGKGKDGGGDKNNNDNINQGSNDNSNNNNNDKTSGGDTTKTEDTTKSPDNPKPKGTTTTDTTATPETRITPATETPKPTPSTATLQCGTTTTDPCPRNMFPVVHCPVGFINTRDKCIHQNTTITVTGDPNNPNTHCHSGTHFVLTLECIKDHLTRDEAYKLGCKLGTTDGPDQENFVGTGPHSHDFTRGYNQAFGGKSCSIHHGGGGNDGSSTNSVSSSSATSLAPLFKESTDIPVETHVSIGPTIKTLDVAGRLHIVGDIKNNGKSSAIIEPQISGRVMNANNRTIGIEYATPLSTTIQPGQSTTFEMLVGGTGIPNPSDISSIQYHVRIIKQ